jgi:hypothetical protein
LYSETVYDANNRPVQKSPFNAADPVYKTPSSTFHPVRSGWPGQARPGQAQSEPAFGTSGAQWTNLIYYDSGDIKTSTDLWQITTTRCDDTEPALRRGRSTATDVGARVVEQNAYDGYDRLVRQQRFDSAGTASEVGMEPVAEQPGVAATAIESRYRPEGPPASY